MPVRPDQISEQLRRGGPAPVYLLAGEEPLLLQEAADAIRRAARESGYAEREVLHAEPGFDWSELSAAGGSLSLFSDKRLIELHLPAKGPGKDGGAALRAFAEAPPEDTLLIVHAGQLDASQRKSAWARALESAGSFVYAWPLETDRLPGWIEARARAAGLRLDEESIAVLAARTEGNLLAAHQEIQRLALLFPDGAVTAEAMRAATADSARFDIFDLPAKALDGDAAGVVRTLERLREEGVDPVPILWALVNDLRLLFRASLAARRGGTDSVLGKVRLPPQRKRQIAAAAERHRPRALLPLLRDAARLDRINKGAERGSAWDELVTLALALAGQPVAAARAAGSQGVR